MCGEIDVTISLQCSIDDAELILALADCLQFHKWDRNAHCGPNQGTVDAFGGLIDILASAAEEVDYFSILWTGKPLILGAKLLADFNHERNERIREDRLMRLKSDDNVPDE